MIFRTKEDILNLQRGIWILRDGFKGEDKLLVQANGKGRAKIYALPEMKVVREIPEGILPLNAKLIPWEGLR